LRAHRHFFLANAIASHRTETVRDTVRRSEVDVEDVPASRPNDVPRGDGARRR